MCRRSNLLVALIASACNWTYGLGTVVERDASYFDAAPSTCPPIGTIPAFDHSDLREIVPQDCTSYSRTAGPERALAECTVAIFDGAPDEALAPAPGLESVGPVAFSGPHVGPDGTTAAVTRVTNFFREVVIVHRVAGAWIVGEKVGDYDDASEPTAGPHPHILVNGATRQIDELVDDGNGTWTRVGSVTVREPSLGVYHLSPDGLRMVATPGGELGALYFDRDSMASPFTERGPIANTTGFMDSFLTPDCGRLYFSTLNGVWFAHRLR